MNDALDTKDTAILNSRIKARDLIQGPRVGDFVLFESGELERISQDWGDQVQTSPGGSFYFQASGQGEFSGGLNPGIPMDSLMKTDATLPGDFWFFHHEISGAHRGVECAIECRVYKTSAKYAGFLGPTFQSAKLQELKEVLKTKTLLTGKERFNAKCRLEAERAARLGLEIQPSVNGPYLVEQATGKVVASPGSAEYRRLLYGHPPGSSN